MAKVNGAAADRKKSAGFFLRGAVEIPGGTVAQGGARNRTLPPAANGQGWMTVCKLTRPYVAIANLLMM
jgi:hypothetical protein